MCRKAFSAQASAYALVNPEEFSWTSGKEMLTSYDSEIGAGLQFCRKCGSTLSGTYNGKIHGVSLGCIDGNPDITLAMHLFVDSKAAWETLPSDDTPQYKEWPPEAI